MSTRKVLFVTAFFFFCASSNLYAQIPGRGESVLAEISCVSEGQSEFSSAPTNTKKTIQLVRTPLIRKKMTAFDERDQLSEVELGRSNDGTQFLIGAHCIYFNPTLHPRQPSLCEATIYASSPYESAHPRDSYATAAVQAPVSKNRKATIRLTHEYTGYSGNNDDVSTSCRVRFIRR